MIALTKPQKHAVMLNSIKNPDMIGSAVRLRNEPDRYYALVDILSQGQKRYVLMTRNGHKVQVNGSAILELETPTGSIYKGKRHDAH